MGPGLFLYYINDLPAKLHSFVRLFADDTIAYLVIECPNDANLLQEDFNTLAEWEQQWRVKFHPSKCTKLKVTNKRNPIQVNYQLHGHIVASVSSAKYLGITVTDDLRWDTNIQSICDKANRTIAFLRRNLSIGSVSIKQQAYFSLSVHWWNMPASSGIHIHRPTYRSWKWSNGERQDTLQVGTETPPVLATCCRA